MISFFDGDHAEQNDDSSTNTKIHHKTHTYKLHWTYKYITKDTSTNYAEPTNTSKNTRLQTTRDLQIYHKMHTCKLHWTYKYKKWKLTFQDVSKIRLCLRKNYQKILVPGNQNTIFWGQAVVCGISCQYTSLHRNFFN